MAVTEAGHIAGRAIDDLYRRHGGEVYRYALAVLGNHADAEDVTQTTFLNAYRALEQGVRPRKPTNWLLTIASNVIKERFRREQSRPRQVELDRDFAAAGSTDDDADVPSVGELLTALSQIPPQQRQAIVLREFEGRSYKEIAAILGVTTTALETLLFRARRSLTEELEQHLTCTEAQQAISRAADGRIGRKERRRLREHIAECPDCAHFARIQSRHRRALRGLALVPIPISLTLFKSFEGSASAATLPAAAGAAAGTSAVTTGGSSLAGGLALKAAAVVAAATVAGGATVAGVSEVTKHSGSPPKSPTPTQTSTGAKSHTLHSQRTGHASTQGLTHGKAIARGQTGATPPGFAHRKSNHGAGKAKAKSAAANVKGHSSGATGAAHKSVTHGSPSDRGASNSPSRGVRPGQSTGSTTTTTTTGKGAGQGKGNSP